MVEMHRFSFILSWVEFTSSWLDTLLYLRRSQSCKFYTVHCEIHTVCISNLLQLFGSRFRYVAVFAPTLISSLVHEYILATGVKFFLPLLTIEFSGFGGNPTIDTIPCLIPYPSPAVLMYYIKPAKSIHKEFLNTLFLLGLSVGFGIMVWGYGFEMYTRYYCPKEVHYKNVYPHSYCIYIFLVAYICQWDVA